MPPTGVGGPYLTDDHLWYGWDIQLTDDAIIQPFAGRRLDPAQSCRAKSRSPQRGSHHPQCATGHRRKRAAVAAAASAANEAAVSNAAHWKLDLLKRG